MNELTMLYHTREEMEVMHRLVQQAIDADDPAGFQMLNSLRTMWAEAMYGVERQAPPHAALVKLTLTDLNQLVATVTGAHDHIARLLSDLDVPGSELTAQLANLRQRLIHEDAQLRRQVGLPT